MFQFLRQKSEFLDFSQNDFVIFLGIIVNKKDINMIHHTGVAMKTMESQFLTVTFGREEE